MNFHETMGNLGKFIVGFMTIVFVISDEIVNFIVATINMTWLFVSSFFSDIKTMSQKTNKQVRARRHH